MSKLKQLLLIILVMTPMGAVRSETVSVTLLELQNALDNANEGSDSVTNELFSKINSVINESALGFNQGELLFSSEAQNVTVEGGCNRTVISAIETTLGFNADSALSFQLDSLYDPVVLTLDLKADILSQGEAQQILGIRLGECQNILRDTFSFKASGPAELSLTVTLMLKPEWSDETTLTLSPEMLLSGNLDTFTLGVDVDDTVISDLIEDYIDSELDDTFTTARFNSELARYQDELNDTLSTSLSDGKIEIELPEANDEQIVALYQFLQPEARFPITMDMIRQNRQRILSALLFGEPASVDGIFADALLCESASAFLSLPNPVSLFTQVDEQCVAADLDNIAGQSLWADDHCQRPIDYQAASVSEYCLIALEPERLGNAALLGNEPSAWTHSPGTRLDIGALSLKGLKQPLMRRYKYKTVQTNRGSCELEMRVYADYSQGDKLKPLIALHGGSWQHRASGFIGIEASASHFTNNGFVVFAPFYRLVGTSDGNAACNDAQLSDAVNDVSDAMDWVLANADEFDVIGKPVVFGQSAGGHLALTLAVNRPEEVRRALLLYAPTDFEDFANQINSGEYTNEAGYKILEAVTGNPIEALDSQSALVIDNTLTKRVAVAPEKFPPMFMLHGEKDSLLPFRQAVRLCNALSGSADLNAGPASLAPNITSYKTTYECGSNGSSLHLIAEGEHALDLCLAPGLCLSGDQESAQNVSDSMRTMLDWASLDTDASSELKKAGKGMVGSNWLVTLFIILLFRRVMNRPALRA